MNRNPAWQRDELILALDLYFQHNPAHISSTNEEVIRLSQILNSLPFDSEKRDKERFRNPNGVYMKLCNFLRCDPSYQGTGLQRGGKLEVDIWNEFSSDPGYLHKVAQGIINGVNILSVTGNRNYNDEEDEFPEGKVLYRLHKIRERNKKLVTKVKEIALLNNNLKCVVCDFDFYKTYGELGKGFIECHHTKPISKYNEVLNTSMNDLALVCSNCHRMLHIKRPWLTAEQLKSLIVL